MIDNTLASVPQVVTVIQTLHSLTTSARLARSANSASVSRKVGHQVRMWIIFTRKHNSSQAVIVMIVYPMRTSFVPTIISASSASVCQQVGDEK